MADNGKLFGTSGIRRKAKDLNRKFVIKLALSLSSYVKQNTVAVGRDTRGSSPDLMRHFIVGLNMGGTKAIDLGVVPTPAVAMASEDYGSSVIITASHNPPEYNGFKFWEDGKAMQPEEERYLERMFKAKDYDVMDVNWTSVSEQDYIQKHKKRILDYVGSVDKEVKILIDCANGAGSVITPDVLREMGSQVTELNCNVEEEFPHGLEPTRENLTGVCKKVKESDVDLGLVHDGDADRVAAINSEGELIDWDSLLSILAYGKDKVVTTVDASMRIEDVCQEVIRTRVGDVAVANAIEKEDADFGGEPSGSFIFPDVHLFPDGILTAAVTAKLLSEDRFYSVLDELESYPTERVKIECEEEMKPNIIGKVMQSIQEKGYDADYKDGVRVQKEKGWFLIRPSGTESIIRVTAEAENKEELDKIAGEGKEIVQNAMD